MNFKEAYKAMQEGKKVRIKTENGYFYYRKNMKRIYHHISEKCFDLPTEEIAIENVLSNDWEVVEDKKECWEPKKDEKYYYITDCGDVDNHLYSNLVVNDDYLYANWLIERARFNMGNCFKTKEEAEHMVEKLKVIHELQKFAYENNEKEIDWNNFSQNKFYLIYDSDVNNIFIDYFSFTRTNPFNIYFTSFKIAKRAIEAVGEDRIKKYYFDIEE